MAGDADRGPVRGDAPPGGGGRVVTLIALFRQTARLMVEELAERLRRAGFSDMTAAHHPVFENIDPGGTRLTVLAARTGMTHQSMRELVQTLERRGYVDRRGDPRTVAPAWCG